MESQQEENQDYKRTLLKILNNSNKDRVKYTKYNSLSTNKKGDEELKNIRQRYDGRWEWRKVINKISYNIIKPTQKQLFKAVIDFKKSLKNNTVIIFKKEYIVIDWLFYWAETYKKDKKIKENSYNLILNYFTNHIKDKTIAKVKIKDLTTTIVQEFFNKMPKTRTKELVYTYFKAALKKAHKLGYMKTDIFEEFSVDAKLNNVAPPFKHAEQVQILKTLKNSDIEHAIMFYLLTGIRKNERPITKEELLSSIDKENHLFTIKCEKKRNNKIVYRNIDLSKSALIYIIEHAEQITKFLPHTVYKKFKKLLEAIGIDGNLKTLRHTFTTNHWYLRNPDKLISSWLGHETVELTQQVYIYIDRTINKQKIIDLYSDLYYTFNN